MIKHSAELAAEVGKTIQLFLTDKKTNFAELKYHGSLGG